MATRKKIIQVPPGSVDKLCKAHNCKRTAVYDALAFNTHSDMAVLIRKDAVNLYGGIQTTKLIMNS